MRHHASPSFWEAYERLPVATQRLADANFELLKQNPWHPSLHLKRVRSYWAVRVGLRFRALGVEVDEGILWFWIGSHAEYDRLIK